MRINPCLQELNFLVLEFIAQNRQHLVYEIYKRDFQLFKYDFENPANKMPIGEIDLDEVHAKLGD